MSHGIDLCISFWTRLFRVRHGSWGCFAWHDGRENADTFQALLTYSKGFLVSYATSLQ